MATSVHREDIKEKTTLRAPLAATGFGGLVHSCHDDTSEVLREFIDRLGFSSSLGGGTPCLRAAPVACRTGTYALSAIL
jgi:hypothetical protein